ncbi:MAG: VCBS repeat-containing protein, partial [Bacteroidota bacterium]
MKWIFFVLLIIVGTTAAARETTTLRNYNLHGPYIHYDDRSIILQAARFDLSSPAKIVRITVLASGVSSGGCMLHIYGNEGGANAPIFEHDIIKPIWITKKKSGVETISIDLSEMSILSGEQFYIAFDNLTNGFLLLSDKRIKAPACDVDNSRFLFQLLKSSDGSWKWGKYGFAVQAIIESVPAQKRPALTDVTDILGLSKLQLFDNGIAWADVTNDGYLDLLVGGRLLRNERGEGFSDISESFGITRHPILQFFIDADNDGVTDFVTIADSAGGDATVILHQNHGGGNFVSIPLALPGLRSPRCFGVADIDGDAYPDIVCGQVASDGDTLNSLLFFRNDRHGSFVVDSTILPSLRSGHGGISALQFIDYDNDGDLDLCTRTSNGSVLIWRYQDSRFSPQAMATPVSAGERVEGAGFAWADYD